MAPAPDASAAHRPVVGRRQRSLRSELNRTAPAIDQGSLMGVELFAGILIWTFLGWLADRWLGTGPWLLGVGAMLGFAGGLYLVWLRSGRMEGGAPAPGRDGEVADG